MSRGHRWWVLVTVTLATFVTTLDNLIVNIALPSIDDELNLSLSTVEWVVSGYILTFSGLMLVGGRLADVFGRRAIFVLGLIIFTAASLVAGLAGSGEVLVTARIVQGVGAALVTPTTLAVISVVFDDERERGQAVAIWTAVTSLALAAGPVAGGLISQHLDWTWIFFLNIPVGLVTLALALALIPESRDTRAGRYVDLPGLATSGIALLCVTYTLIQGPVTGWSDPTIVAAAVLAVLTAAAFALVERRVRTPMLDLDPLRNRYFGGGAAIQLMWGLGFTGVLLFTSLYLQNILDFTPTGAGLLYLPLAVAVFLLAPVAPAIAGRLGAHRTGALGFGLAAVGLLVMVTLGEDATALQVLPGFVLVGVGTALTTPLTSVVLGVLPEARSGLGSSILNAAREVAGLLGVVVVGAVLVARRNLALDDGASDDVAFLRGYHAGLVISALFVVGAAVISWLMLAPRREPARVPVSGAVDEAAP